jgi:GNAT superfamily N-acetyltransferase
MSAWGAPQPIQRSHLTDGFDCTDDALNLYLKKFALANHTSGAAATFVLAQDDLVIGYYSLAATSISYEEAPSRAKAGLPRHPIPAILLARLAVDHSQQGRKLGSMLIKHAMQRTLKVAEEVGVRMMLIDAKNERVANLYERIGFSRFENDPLKLYMLRTDLQKHLDPR